MNIPENGMIIGIGVEFAVPAGKQCKLIGGDVPWRTPVAAGFVSQFANALQHLVLRLRWNAGVLIQYHTRRGA